MARSLTGAMITEIKSSFLRPVAFVEIEFTDGFTRVWTGIGDKSFLGFTWSGVGDLGKISPINESIQLRADGIRLSLSGIPQSMITDVLSNVRRGQAVNVYFGILDDNENIIADPYPPFKGQIDVPMIDEGGATATVTITAENLYYDLNRSRERRFTPEDQLIDFPGDLGFDYVAGIQELKTKWGFGSDIPVGSPPDSVEEEHEDTNEFGSGSFDF